MITLISMTDTPLNYFFRYYPQIKTSAKRKVVVKFSYCGRGNFDYAMRGGIDKTRCIRFSIKKIFSWKSWGEFLINFIKLSVIVALIFNVVWEVMGHPVFHHQSYLAQVIAFIAEAALSLLKKVLAAMIIIAAIDYAYQWWRMRDGLKMSVKDVKDEEKNQDGDPHMKSEQRKRRMGVMQKNIWDEVPEADVVVTNPTHLAVALKYDRKTMKSPKIVAKGARYNALLIREIAEKNGVPLVENKPLAQMLYKFGRTGKEIPFQLFSAVAEILAYVYRTNRFRYFKQGREVPA